MASSLSLARISVGKTQRRTHHKWAIVKVRTWNVTPRIASSAGLGRRAKRGTAMVSYSLSEARHLVDRVILLVGLRSLFSLVFRRPRHTWFAAPASSLTSRMSCSPSRLQFHLFCVLPHGQEAAPILRKPRNSRHLQVLFIVKSYVYQAIMLGSTIVLSFKLSRVIDILFFLSILKQPPPQASLLRRGSKRSL